MKHFYKKTPTKIIITLFFFTLLSLSSWAEDVMPFYEKPIKVPAITWQNMAGDTLSIEDFKGKVVLLNLWATWCGPCAIEMPSFNFLQKRYKAGGFEVVAIALNDSVEAIKPYMKKHKLTYLTPFIDVDNKVGKAFRPKSIPTTYLVNRQGEIIAGKEGLSDWLSSEMMTLIESELRKNQASFKNSENIQVIDRNDIHGAVHQ